MDCFDNGRNILLTNAVSCSLLNSRECNDTNRSNDSNNDDDNQKLDYSKCRAPLSSKCLHSHRGDPKVYRHSVASPSVDLVVSVTLGLILGHDISLLNIVYNDGIPVVVLYDA